MTTPLATSPLIRAERRYARVTVAGGWVLENARVALTSGDDGYCWWLWAPQTDHHAGMALVETAVWHPERTRMRRDALGTWLVDTSAGERVVEPGGRGCGGCGRTAGWQPWPSMRYSRVPKEVLVP